MSFSVACLISTLSKYPERLSCVMKFATALIEAASPCMSMRIAGPVERGQPEGVDVHHRVGDHLQQVLAAGAIPLQRLDHVDALLQNGLLALEPVHFLLDLLQAGFFRAQRRRSWRWFCRARSSAGSR